MLFRSKYNFNFTKNLSATLDFDSTFEFFFDTQGNVIGYKVEEAATPRYLYVSQMSSKAAGENLIDGDNNAAVKVAVTYFDGTKEVLDYVVKIATASTSGIAKGKSYITFMGTNVEVTTGSTMIPKGVYAYNINDDGKVTLNALPTAGDVLGASASATLKTTRGGAAVEFDGTTKYAARDARLVLVDGNTVSTYTGYANFPGQTFTIGSASNQVDYIAYITNKGTVTDIIVIGGSASAQTDDVYGAYVRIGNVTSDGTEYIFLVDGAEKTYVKDGTAPIVTKGAIYLISATDAGVLETATAAANVTNEVVVGATVTTSVDDAYVVAGGKVYNLNGDSGIYNVAKADSADWGTDTVKVNDTVTIIFELDSSSNAVVKTIFITHR